MSWEESPPIERICPCGNGHYLVISRSDDWGRFEERWEMQCRSCSVEYGLYAYDSNRKGLATMHYSWLSRVVLQELSIAATELAQSKEALSVYARTEFVERWNRHFNGKTKKNVWRELTEDGKHYPSLPTFYAHVRHSTMQRELDRYFEWHTLPTVARVLELSRSELQSRIEHIQELERLLEAKHSHARQNSVT